MKSLSEVAATLRGRLKETRTSQRALLATVGISPTTLNHVLSGVHDYKLTTLLAVADRLGLELVLVPKAGASAVGYAAPSAPVSSLVDLVLKTSTPSTKP